MDFKISTSSKRIVNYNYFLQIRVHEPVTKLRAMPMETKSTAPLCPNTIICPHPNPGNDAQMNNLLPTFMQVHRKVVYG